MAGTWGGLCGGVVADSGGSVAEIGGGPRTGFARSGGVGLKISFMRRRRHHTEKTPTKWPCQVAPVPRAADALRSGVNAAEVS